MRALIHGLKQRGARMLGDTIDFCRRRMSELTIEMESSSVERVRELDVAILSRSGQTTLSAELGLKVELGTATAHERALCDALNQVDPDHCAKALEEARARGELAPAMTERIRRPLLQGLQEDFSMRVAQVLARRTHPTTITSAHRSPAENVAAGGKRDSQHLLGLAVDVVPADGNRRGLVDAFNAVGLFAFAEIGQSHVHAQLLERGRARAIGLFG